MSPENEQLQQMIHSALRQFMGEHIVIAVPQGVAVLRSDGRHTLIRIDDAFLEVAR